MDLISAGDSAFVDEEYSKALDLYTQALQASPSDPQIARKISLTQAKLGVKSDPADVMSDKSAVSAGTKQTTAPQKGDSTASEGSLLESMKSKGNALFKEGKFKEAIEAYKAALAHVTASQEDQATKLTILTNLANVSFRIEDYEGSELFAQAALEMNSKHAKALYFLIKATLWQRNIEAASTAANLALALESADASLAELAGATLFAKDSYDILAPLPPDSFPAIAAAVRANLHQITTKEFAANISRVSMRIKDGMRYSQGCVVDDDGKILTLDIPKSLALSDSDVVSRKIKSGHYAIVHIGIDVLKVDDKKTQTFWFKAGKNGMSSRQTAALSITVEETKTTSLQNFFVL